MTEKQELEVWAHRGGGAGSFQENSLEAIVNTLENDSEKLELDVWLHDGVLVLSHDEPSDHKHLLLTDAFKLIDGNAEIYLDIKHTEAALAVHELVNSQYIEHYDSVIFASFEVETLQKINNQSAAARLGLNYRGIDDNFIDTAKELNIEYVAFNWKRVIPNYFNIKQSRQELDAKYLAYTVNTPAVAGLMKRMGMNGIISDFPTRFITEPN